LIICLSRTALPESWSLPGSSAPVNGDGPPEQPPQTYIQLAPLSEADCRLLVIDILRKLPEIPADLCDLIVTRSEGNPFYVEELVKVLIEDGVILAGSERWQVQRSQLTSLRVPLTLTGVLQARLDRLSALERVTLQRAAVVGRVFWDSLMIEMNNMADEPLSATETFTALQALEKRELIFQRQVSMFAGARTYFFKHAILREVTYESVLLRERPAYHKQVADWLAKQSGERVAEYAGLIARHYELAGEKTPAAELYEIAGIRSQDMYDPEVATDYYARALSLLSDKSHDATWQLRLQERLGELLRLQARLVEAAQTYMTMRYTAKMDGDLIMEARAWNGLAGIQREQADYAAMLESASQAEQVAWLVSADLELARILLYKCEAYWRLDDTELALASARRALEISQRTNDADQTALGLSLLSSIYLELGRQTRATHYLERLEEQLQALDRETPPKTIAFNKVLLGRVYNRLGHYDKAAYHLLGALKLYREADYQLAVGNTLNALAETARLRGNPRAAVPLCRQALAVAEGIGNYYDTLAYHTNLGGALVDLGNYQAAEIELRGVISLAEDYSKVVTWRGLADTYRFLAQACLGQEQVMEALSWAHRARHFALHNGGVELLGMTWRVLGQVVAQLPPQVLPVTIEDDLYDAPGCFAESLRLLQEANSGASVHRERVRTLWAWAAYELARGNKERGREMAQEAQAIAEQLGMELPK
jgi:tetratricopeptide (TPR) repeat protein